MSHIVVGNSDGCEQALGCNLTFLQAHIHKPNINSHSFVVQTYKNLYQAAIY